MSSGASHLLADGFRQAGQSGCDPHDVADLSRPALLERAAEKTAKVMKEPEREQTLSVRTRAGRARLCRSRRREAGPSQLRRHSVAMDTEQAVACGSGPLVGVICVQQIPLRGPALTGRCGGSPDEAPLFRH